MIDIRIYRAALLPALLALIVVMFSLEDRPAPLTSTLAPDAFDSDGAYATTKELAERYPDRRPGTEGNVALAELVRGRLQSLNFETRVDRFQAEVEGDDVSMVNVVGALSGPSDRQVVVLAHRDSAQRPGASSLAATATLLELATAVAGVRHQKTIVFVSTDGATADSAGARRFAERFPDREKIDAALVLDEIASADPRQPYLIPWSRDSGRGSIQLFRSAAVALEREIGFEPHSEAMFGQFMRQAWPLTLREQGPLLAEGIDGLTLTRRGELPSSPEGDTVDKLSAAALLRSGKAALATVLAVDAVGGVESSPHTYLASDRNVIPGWALSLLALSLLAPPLVAAVDALARARRRGRRLGRWMAWVLATSAPFLAVLVAARLFQLLGWLPDSAPEALAEPSRPSFAEAAPALSALALLLVLVSVGLRRMMGGPPDALAAPAEASLALTLVLSLEVFLVWLSNPFAALLLLPVAHMIFLGAHHGSSARRLPSERPGRSLLAAAIVFCVALLPLLVLLYYGSRFDLGIDPTRYALMIVTNFSSLPALLIAGLVTGSLVSAVRLALAARPRSSEPEITVRGPASYAGPGSLGGTESALRR